MINPYIHFTNLLEKQTKYIGTIMAVYDNGSARVKKLDSSTVNVKGGDSQYDVGDVVYIMDGFIMSKLDNVQDVLEISVI